MSVRVVVMARFPEPGRCKTRLIPALGPEGAAKTHRKLAEHTVHTVRSARLPLELWGTGAGEERFTDWFGALTYRQQPEGDLGQRLLAACDPCPVVFLGTDCPELAPAHVLEAADRLEKGAEVVIGPAEDGGYWTLGLARPLPALFEDMPWGTDAVFGLTAERAREAGIEPSVLQTLPDLDRPGDLERFASFRP